MFSFGYMKFLRDLRQGCRLNDVRMGRVKRESVHFLESAIGAPIAAGVSTDWLVRHWYGGLSTAGVFGFSVGGLPVCSEPVSTTCSDTCLNKL